MEYIIETNAKRVQQGINMIIREGGSFASSGFSIKGIKGTATYSNRILTVNITSKPSLLSWNTIETKLRKFFKNKI